MFRAASYALPAVVSMVGTPEDGVLNTVIGSTPKRKHQDLERCSRHRVVHALDRHYAFRRTGASLIASQVEAGNMAQ
jgi:hypothetical protein